MQCLARTKSGKRCKNKAQAGSDFCGVHAKLAGTVQTTFEYDVFLSYSSKDKETVHALAERLRRDGVRVWLDVWEIEPSAGSLSPGERARVRAEAIQHGVEKSRTMVMCMSPDYFESEWGRLEHHSMLFRDPTNALRRFLPLLIKDCQPPDIIAQFARVDWRTSDQAEYERLLDACQLDELETAKPSVAVPRADHARMVLEGHGDEVWCVAVTPDGKTVVSGAKDGTLKVWDLETGEFRTTFDGHTDEVRGVAITRIGREAISSSSDKTLRVWSLESGECTAILKGAARVNWGVAVSGDDRTVVSASTDNTVGIWQLDAEQPSLKLEGHTETVLGVAISDDCRIVVSGSSDHTLRVWDLETARCRFSLEGHTSDTGGVAITPDAKTVVSTGDETLKVWDLETGACRATFEGHTGPIYRVAITPDGKRVVSGSSDNTVKVWDLASGRCIATFEGHSGTVYGLAISPDGRAVISGSSDKTLRVWDLPTPDAIVEDADSARYTNAKVVLVGESGAGKTGFALRLAEDRWQETESTHGMNVWPLKLPGLEEVGMEREVWLWDFAGQPDYRLIHQLYMDETALGVLVFDPQDDNPFENIGYWDKALSAATKLPPSPQPSPASGRGGGVVKLLVAGRCDRGGITVSRKRFEDFVQEHGFADFLFTGAKIGEGCEELKTAVTRHIPWERLPWTATSRLFKTLKDAILKFTDAPRVVGRSPDRSTDSTEGLKSSEGRRPSVGHVGGSGDPPTTGPTTMAPPTTAPLARLSELRQRLQLSLPKETIDDADLRAVVGLMQGQGVVQVLGFGDFVLLQPEWINRYASVVVRMAREHADEMGVVAEQQVLDGRLDYKDMHRLDEADEKILLRAMVQTLLDRSLCIREQTTKGTMLVFPSYFRRDKPDQPEHPNVFVTYEFSGPLDDIYATLVVRLNYSNVFKKDQLWKDAADFKTPEGKLVGLAMTKRAEGAAKIVVYFEAETPDDTKVTFIKYVHEHLLAKAQPRESVTRVRTYVCPHCNEPLENQRAIQNRLNRGLKDIVCADCDGRVPLFDLIEEKFASDEFSRRVREMDEQAGINLDNESKELILVGHSMAIAGEAGQIYRITAQPDWGIDAEIEFKNSKAEASGKRVYLQLKSGDSYLYHRQRDDVEIFTIKKRRWAEYWLSQAYPVMLVIRSADGKIRWMNITEYLRRHGVDTKQVVFEGEPFTAGNVALMRNKVLGEA